MMKPSFAEPIFFCIFAKNYLSMDNEIHNSKSLPITEWPEEDRPREKMRSQGKKSLTDSELLAILLRTGIKGASAIDLAKAILHQTNGRLTDLARLEVNDLQSNHKGLGLAKSVTILAALELGNRMLKENSENKEDIVHDSNDLFRYIAPTIIDLPHEEFWAIFLTQRNKISWKQRIGAGGLTQTTVDLRLIFRAALEHNAVALAVAHNHPSGRLQPSQPDKELTQRIAEAGKILHIKLLDHLIIGILPSAQKEYFSFADNGLL